MNEWMIWSLHIECARIRLNERSAQTKMSWLFVVAAVDDAVSVVGLVCASFDEYGSKITLTMFNWKTIWSKWSKFKCWKCWKCHEIKVTQNNEQKSLFCWKSETPWAQINSVTFIGMILVTQRIGIDMYIYDG